MTRKPTGDSTGKDEKGDDKSEWCRSVVNRFRPSLTPYETIYRDVHQNPDLSMVESDTEQVILSHLKELGISEVHRDLGGFGIACVIRNGEGPAVMVRADIDALPIEELTNLTYASKKVQTDRHGNKSPVMHACGHDFHVACLLAAMKLWLSAREQWAGSITCIFQPGEEDGAGARAMVRDGLFTKVPKPDVILGQHVERSKAGSVQIRAGHALSACDSFDIRLFGKGGHGSSPHQCIDPVLAACAIVVRIQGIVAREIDPADFGVITCAYLHAGKAANIVPDTVQMKIEIRSYTAAVRVKLVEALKRVIRAESEASGLPKPPEIVQTDDIPSVFNDAHVVEKLRKVFSAHLHGDVQEMARDTGSDDFSVFTEDQHAPSAYWIFGGTDPEVWQRARKEGRLDELPSNHEATFAPCIQPTLRTGTDAMAFSGSHLSGSAAQGGI